MFGLGGPELLLIVFLCAPMMLNGFLARRKGRSILNWATLGLLFSFISTVVLLLLGKPKAAA